MAAMIAETVSAASSTSLKRARIVAFVSGRGMSLQGNFRDDAKGALAANEEPRQIVSDDALHGSNAQVQYLSGRQHYLQTEHIVPRHAVLEGIGASRAFRHIPPDARILIRSGVGGIEKPFLCDLLLEEKGDDSRLHDGDEVRRIDLQYPVHPG